MREEEKDYSMQPEFPAQLIEGLEHIDVRGQSKVRNTDIYQQKKSVHTLYLLIHATEMVILM